MTTSTAVRTTTATAPAVRIEADELSPFLAATPMCDSGTSTVRTLAEVVTRDAGDTREAAVALFYWIRDRIEYTMGDWNWKASETLRLRKGTCSNKANLLVAMARSLGIPAGFHIQYVTTEGFFDGADPDDAAGSPRPDDPRLCHVAHRRTVGQVRPDR